MATIQGTLRPDAPPAPRRGIRRQSARGHGHEIGDTLLGRWMRLYLPVLFFLFVTLFPFYWMFITSFKSPSELLDFKQSPLFVIHPTLEHYRHLFTQTNFARWSLNTTVVAVVSTMLSLVCSVLAGYSLARLRYPGASTIGWGIFVTYLVPPTLLFLPLAFLIRQLHLFNNLWSLILTYPTFLIPFSTWLLIGYFKSIPRELEESALVDGATRVQAMVRIVVPLALPGILSAAIFAFTLSWNEFLYSLIFMNDTIAKTISVGVTSELIRGDDFFWGELMAASLLGSLPVALLYSFFVDRFVAGMTAGAVKG
ncbi:MAG: carbohydrate ABC transporter permease [Bacillati bacterium ANGP1]|uniref:Carbohydrate ABC transporter permease n=1 Tax=Candidatus Segetimicrobium genomatis TaxID=2569760 RepID=A0A537JBP8_9BACT|nr:MAG: carbohydrate ABC transporter permease [Terrabacteria group bacterium ANGP1]